jgi:hypothetical protein
MTILPINEREKPIHSTTSKQATKTHERALVLSEVLTNTITLNKHGWRMME